MLLHVRTSSRGTRTGSLKETAGDKNMSKGKEPEIIISSDEEDPGGDSQDEHVDTLNVRAPYQHVSILSREITVPSLFVPLLLVFTVLGPCWDGRTQTDF